ncbi:MAG TPA: FAD-dependent oxidoreductase [Desulfosarcina sp.]|nr:FAD-dependent oxidoreductase [Desulfosarcina sp.]
MNAVQKHVAVIGAGVAGLTAADALAERGLRVSLIEKTPFLGGHAVQLNCKATDACVKCGACVAEEKLRRAVHDPGIGIFTGTEIETVTGENDFRLSYRTHSPLVNADRCNGCGICLQKCPVPGAILQGRAPRVGAYVAIRRDLCRFFDHAACTVCRDICPQRAIQLDSGALKGEMTVDAILVATGFSTYNPGGKPYGYGKFPDVVTSLDAERMLRDAVVLKRPSDGRPVKRLAFIQCVGSRDASLGHLWCSKICCGSSLRMARLIQSRQADVQITFFYIDVQTFGRDFADVYPQITQKLTMVRAIPGEITKNAADGLEVVYFDPATHESRQAGVDVVILSVGLVPPADNRRLAGLLGVTTAENGFMPSREGDGGIPPGIFFAGSALGPMSIAESIGSAEKTAFDMLRYLGDDRADPL